VWEFKARLDGTPSGIPTLLRDLETDVKVQQELMRHADISTTLNIYTQALSKKKAARKAVKALLKDRNKKGTVSGPQVVLKGFSL
jgi:integrase